MNLRYKRVGISYSIEIMDTEKYKIVAKGTPVISTKGRKKKQACNMFWEVIDKETGDKHMLMEVFNNSESRNDYVKFSVDKIKTVLKVRDYRPVYYINPSGQVAFNQPKGKGKTKIAGLQYMSEVVMEYYGDKKIPQSRIEFINNNRLDVRTENLKIRYPAKYLREQKAKENKEASEIEKHTKKKKKK